VKGAFRKGDMGKAINEAKAAGLIPTRAVAEDGKIVLDFGAVETEDDVEAAKAEWHDHFKRKRKDATK
jgi:hypothetical protein